MRTTLQKSFLYILQNIPLIVVFLIPIFFLTGTVDIFAFNKFYLINILASIALLSWCGYNLTTKRINLAISPSQTALFFVALVHITSAVFMSPTKVLSLSGITTLFISIFLIHLTSTSVTVSKNQIKSTIFTLLASLFLVNLVTILHFFKLTSFILDSNLITSQYFNLTGGVVPALGLSVSILIGSIAYAFYEQDTKTKAALFFLSGVTITACIINISLLLPKDRISPINQLPLGASWSIALDIFKYPGTALVGTGPENYLATFTRLRPTTLNNGYYWNTRFNESGSLFLTILTTTGLIGGIAFLQLFIKTIFLGLRKNNLPEDKPELSFLIGTIVPLFIILLITPSGIVNIVIAGVLLGLTVQLQKKQNLKHTRTIHFNISSEDNQSNVLKNYLPIFTLIVSLGLIITYWTFGINFYRASVLLRQANKQMASDLTGSFLKQQQAQSLNPYDATYSIILSQTYQKVALFYLQKQSPTELDKQNAIDAMQRTIDAGRQAAKIDPFNVLVWENLSNIYQTFIGAAQGSEDLAISHLSQAINLDPTNPKLRLQLGILFYNLKDKEQALKLINQSLELKPNWEMPYVNLFRIYLEDKDYLKAQGNLKQALSLISPSSDNYQKLQEELVSLTEKINEK